MSVARSAVGGTAFRDKSREKPRRHRFGLMLLVSLVVGAAAGYIAFATLWMPTLFGAVHAGSTQPQIEASLLFPSPAPVQQTVDVYDAAPAYVRSGDDGGGGSGHDD